MYKSFAIVLLAVLVLTTAVQASIGRDQSVTIGAVNRVLWEGGIGSARSEGQASFAQAQQFVGRCSGVSTRQTAGGTLTQTATATGTGLGTARQTADIRGSQDLLAENTRQLAGRSQQDLAVRMDNRLFKPNGIGSVTGAQSFSGAQEQAQTTPYGTSSQSQSVDVRQSGSIGTQTNVDPLVRNTVDITLHQAQTTSGQ